MKLYRLIVGQTEAYGVAEDENDMEQRKAEVDESFAYLPVRFEEVTVAGYRIVVTPDESVDGVEAPRRRRKAASE
jgi:hypothetical protein